MMLIAISKEGNMQEYQEKDARSLANNKAERTRELNLVYRQFQTRSMSEDALRSQILKILNNKYPETLVDPIIKELELRYQLRDQISRMLSGNEVTTLKSNQLVLDTNDRISVTETIRQYYL